MGARPHDHKHVRHAGGHGVGGDFGGSDFGEDIVHFRKRFDFFLQRVLHGYRLVQSGTGNPQGVHRHILFVQCRNEFRAQAGAEQQTENHQNARHGEHCGPVVQSHIQQGGVQLLRRPDKRIFLFRDASGCELRHHRGNKSQGQNQRARQRRQHGERHGLKHFAFDAGQGQDRQVNDHDDEHPENTGAGNLDRGLPDDKMPFFGVQFPVQAGLFQGQAPHAVFDDDDRAVDDDAEIDGSQAQQVAADFMGYHTRDGEQHGQGNRQCGDKSGAKISQQQKQHQNDEQRPFG